MAVDLLRINCAELETEIYTSIIKFFSFSAASLLWYASLNEIHKDVFGHKLSLYRFHFFNMAHPIKLLLKSILTITYNLQLIYDISIYHKYIYVIQTSDHNLVTLKVSCFSATAILSSRLNSKQQNTVSNPVHPILPFPLHFST